MRTRRSQSSSNPVSSSRVPAEGHAPVLLHEIVENLSIVPDDVVVDATLGGAGHAKALAGALGRHGVFIGFDLDREAIARAEHALSDARPHTHLIEANFRELSRELEKIGIRKITKVLFDLGWSGYQLDSGRGFSFKKDEPLLMTYGVEAKPGAQTAKRIVNEWAESSIADVLYGWGEERYARRIARAIVEARKRTPIETSLELADIVVKAVPAVYRRGKIHPATRTFQALRIAVNDELGALSEGLKAAWQHLGPGGRIAVISFHSIEDRIVKRQFAEWEKEGMGKRLTKKPLKATAEELNQNPRARSAKLRIIEKL